MADHLDQGDHLDTEPATLPPVDASALVEVRRAAIITACVGIAHAVLLVLAFWLVRSNAAGVNASDADIVTYYEDADNRRRIIAAGLYLLPFSGIAFIWFIVAL